jgi:hypothetical protein
MSNPGLLDGAFDAFDDPTAVPGTIERIELPQSGRNGKNGGGTPAWKRIEELREMRELNRHIKDDIYGSKPVRALWSE